MEAHSRLSQRPRECQRLFLHPERATAARRAARLPAWRRKRARRRKGHARAVGELLGRHVLLRRHALSEPSPPRQASCDKRGTHGMSGEHGKCGGHGESEDSRMTCAAQGRESGHAWRAWCGWITGLDVSAGAP